jgi:uncharacterized protein (DUF58 family)
VVVCIGALAYIAGWQLGWIELMVLAAGCALATAIAVPFVIGRMRLDVIRTLDPPRVMAGHRAVAVLDVKNPGSSPIRPRIIEDSVADRYVRVEVPSLGSGERHQTVYPLPTSKRGTMMIGPAVIARQDPLQLMRREVRHANEQRFWVHPRYLPLSALPVGFAKDLEGPTSDTSPAGDVAFHALREYQFGDDYRHIHWMSTARANKPMVRHYVDNRRPQLLVVIDDRATSLSGQQFEVAMEIAASLAVSSLLHQEPLALWTTAGPLMGRTKPGARDDVLDRMAELTPAVDGDVTAAVLTGIRTESGTSAVVVVTGGVEPADLVLVASQAKRHARVIIVRVWPDGAVEPGSVPGARVIDVDRLNSFRRAWEGVTR